MHRAVRYPLLGRLGPATLPSGELRMFRFVHIRPDSGLSLPLIFGGLNDCRSYAQAATASAAVMPRRCIQMCPPPPPPPSSCKPRPCPSHSGRRGRMNLVPHLIRCKCSAAT